MHGYLMHEKLYEKMRDKIEQANISDVIRDKVEN